MKIFNQRERKMFNKFCAVLLGIGMIFIAGCKYETISNIYVVDINEIQTTGKGVTLESMIKIEMPNRDVFQENKAKIKNLLTPYFDVIGDLHCEDSDMFPKAVAKVNIPLISERGSAPQKEFMHFIIRNKQKFPGFGTGTQVAVQFNSERFQQFQSAIESEFFDTVDPGEFKLNLILHNDQKQPIDVMIASSYVDGEPVHLTKVVNLKKRKSVNIVYSKIFMESTITKSGNAMFIIKDQQS